MSNAEVLQALEVAVVTGKKAPVSRARDRIVGLVALILHRIMKGEKLRSTPEAYSFLVDNQALQTSEAVAELVCELLRQIRQENAADADQHLRPAS